MRSLGGFARIKNLPHQMVITTTTTIDGQPTNSHQTKPTDLFALSPRRIDCEPAKRDDGTDGRRKKHDRVGC